MRSHLSFTGSISCLTGVLSGNLYWHLYPELYLIAPSPKLFRVQGLSLRPFDLCGIIFWKGWEIRIKFHSSPCGNPFSSEAFVEDSPLYSLMYILGIFAKKKKNQMSARAWASMWVFNSIPLVNVSGFVSVSYKFYCYVSVV